MALISLLTRLVNGVQRQVDLSANTLVVQELKLNGTLLTSTAGSTAIGDSGGFSNLTPTAATVRGALEGIDTALGTKANVDLSNLSASTAVNNDIKPATDLGVNLGSTAKRWNSLFASSVKNSSGNKILDVVNQTLNDAAGLTAVDAANRLLEDSSGSTSLDFQNRTLKSGATTKLDWSGTNLNVNTRKIINLSAGSGAGDAVEYAQAILASGANAWTANQSLGGNKITNAADPTAAQDYVTKAYADAITGGLDPKASVRAATTAALPAVTYNNGASGVGATLTANANGALPAQDGTTLVNGNRLLVKNQAAALQNGLYVVTDVGSGGTPFILTRATDQDGSPANEVSGGNFSFVETGTLYSGSGWTVIWDGNVTIGTDPMNWSQFSSITFIGGDMITITGNTISVDLATTSGLESTNPGNVSGQLRIKLEASNPTLKFTGSNEIAAKLDAAGAIVTGASGLAVAVDNSSIEVNSNALRVKAAGITLAMHASNSVDENKIVSTTFSATGAITGGSGTKVAVAVDGSSIEISSNALRIKTSAYDQVTITGGGGSAAAVAQAPVVAWSELAGQSFSANTTYAVRYGLTDNSETAGRVYACSIVTSSFDLFWAIGFIQTTGAVSAGQTVSVISSGSLTLKSADTNFGGSDTGKAIYLQSGGINATTTPPATAGQAVLKLGTVQSTTSFRAQIGAPYVN